MERGGSQDRGLLSPGAAGQVQRVGQGQLVAGVRMLGWPGRGLRGGGQRNHRKRGGHGQRKARLRTRPEAAAGRGPAGAELAPRSALCSASLSPRGWAAEARVLGSPGPSPSPRQETGSPSFTADSQMLGCPQPEPEGAPPKGRFSGRRKRRLSSRLSSSALMNISLGHTWQWLPALGCTSCDTSKKKRPSSWADRGARQRPLRGREPWGGQMPRGDSLALRTGGTRQPEPAGTCGREQPAWMASPGAPVPASEHTCDPGAAWTGL